mgnify:FL=1|jgi:hypothetical protein|tara:strand:- start:713 stop:2632 length:1920 start_codon:yes stop_codon:yes gene_type:complete
MTKTKQEKNKFCLANDCTHVLPTGRRKYCSDKCANRIKKRAYRANKATDTYQVEKIVDTNVQKRRGNYYAIMDKKNFFDDLLKGTKTKQEVADILGCSLPTVTRSLSAYLKDEALRVNHESLQKNGEAQAALDDFVEFRDKYFLTEQNVPYETPEFQKRWIDAILETIKNGKRLMVLSPPRHGKTDLLTHFCVYMICKNPNMRIMWVGGNEDIAKNAVGSVLDHLENNEQLIQDYATYEGFRPMNKSGKSWSTSQFTVATRTVSGIKSPTLVAVGKGGKILSRDADLIISDDIEDHGSTVQPSARENTKNWWTTTLQSRKEEHTGMVVIGSRQHPDDLYNALLNNDAWETIVERAHDLEIPLDQESNDQDEHMLWKGKRSHKWLMEQLAAAETTGGRAIFEMVYLNKAVPAGMELFGAEMIDSCLDRSRILGDVPPHTALIAGLDPASTGYQAAVLWAYNQKTGQLWLVDLRNDLGGGISKALKVMQEWHEQYFLSHWIVEENGFQKAIGQDKEIKNWAGVNGVRIEGHQTYKNKWDPVFGVTAMVPMYEQQKINLPWGNPQTQRKVNVLRQQLIYFSSASGTNSKSVNSKTDLVMASWFPMKRVRQTVKLMLSEVDNDYNPSYSNYKLSTYDERMWDR